MLKMLFVLPFADFKTLQVPALAEPVMSGDIGPPLALLALLLAVVFAFLWLARRSTSGRARPFGPTKPENWIVVDGSNVMHWQDNSPQLAPVLRVLEDLQARGYSPGVVFDANVGWKLFGRYLGDTELAALLLLPVNQVFVVPKGTQADPYILDTARKFKARIVTNDRYRDWAEAHPEVAEPGFLVRGGMRDGKLRMDGLPEAVERRDH
jgi:hypothetical protein